MSSESVSVCVCACADGKISLGILPEGEVYIAAGSLLEASPSAL